MLSKDVNEDLEEFTAFPPFISLRKNYFLSTASDYLISDTTQDCTETHFYIQSTYNSIRYYSVINSSDQEY